MVKPVSLSDPAFAALREEKKVGESDSDVVLRLIAEVERNRKDPQAFLKMRRRVPMDLSPDAHKAFVRRLRDADQRRVPGGT